MLNDKNTKIFDPARKHLHLKNKRKQETGTNEVENGYSIRFCPFHTSSPTLN